MTAYKWIACAVAVAANLLAAPQVEAQCVGDCDGDGSVNVAELVVGVNIALGSQAIEACAAFDCQDSGTVPINCLVQGVARALDGCGATNSPTPAPTLTPTSTASPTPNSAACPSTNFLDVTGAAGAGDDYPAPSLAASCTGTTVTVQSNGIPTYQYVSLTPVVLEAMSYNFTFPRSPVAAANTTDVPLIGHMGVAVNGIPIYSANEGARPDPYGDPIAAAILDECGSHAGPRGDLHNHQLVVKCLLQSAVSHSQPWNDPDPSTDQPSPIVGYAFDGFPIYGPYECTDVGCSSVQQMVSGWDNIGYQAGTVGCTSSAACSEGYCANVLIDGAPTTACVPSSCVWSNNAYRARDGSQYLDQCNGHHGPNGDYHYHTTATFPYILGCYRGTPTNNGGNGTPPGGTCAAVPTPALTQ